MSRSTVYRESDSREYSYESEQPRRVTVKKYQMPDSRSTLGAEETKEKVVIRTRSAQPPSYRDRERDEVDIRIRESDGRGDDWRVNERINYSDRDRGGGRDSTYRVVERDTDYENDRQSRVGNRTEYRSSDYRSSYYEQDRETTRVPDPPSQNRTTEYRFERERDFSPRERPRSDYHHHDRDRDDSYEVERYVKETDYYSPPERPRDPPIIIREERPRDPPIIIRESAPQPIIIREERREPRYEFVEREERDESKSLVKSEKESQPPPSPSPQPQPQPQPQQDEDYFYERRVIERDRAPPRRQQSNDRHTEIKPKDSASNYSSDDSYEHVRRETTYYGDREEDHHHKRHLAEGALVGAAAGEIYRHHRKSQGENAGGRIKSGLGGAALGALGAEAITRYRSRSRRRRSVSRSSSGSRGSRRSRRSRRDTRRSYSRSRSGSRSRSRSRSMSRKQIAGLAGVAALGALGGYALSKKNKKETVVLPPGDGGRRRSRSRRRAVSADDYMMDQARDDDKHRDPEHRNRRIAQAGLASAAAAGIVERVRSKSKGRRGKSKTRLQQGVPIAAAGLGGAALAGLYEKNRATKEAKRDAIVEDERNRGRSRSRSRSRGGGYLDDRGSVDSRGNMVAYGNDPVYHDAPRGQYSDEEPGQYRRRGGSAGSSPDNRNRRRSRSRNRNMAEAGAAAGVAAVAAHEMGKRHGRNSARDQGYGDPYYNQGPQQSPYSPPPSGYLPPQQQNAGYPAQPQYPGGTYFPPPPTGDNAYAYNDNAYQQPPQQQQNPYPSYNPADWAQGGAQPPHNPYETSRGVYDESDANLGAPHGNETYAGDNRGIAEEQQPQQTPAPDERRRGREPDNNVSAPNGSTNTNEREAYDAVTDQDSVKSPRARSTSRVRFNLDANEAHSPEAARRRSTKQDEPYSDSETTKRRHRRRKSKRSGGDMTNDKYERSHSGATHSHAHGHGHGHGHRDDNDDSDGTEDLPDRFDKHGNKIGETPDALQDLLGNLANKFLSGGGGDDDSRSGRRRHRH